MRDFTITLNWEIIRETSLNEVLGMLPHLCWTADTDGDMLIGWNPMTDALVFYDDFQGYFDGYNVEICSKQLDCAKLEELETFLPYVKNMEGVTLEYLEEE